jgi:hypothetical protein
MPRRVMRAIGMLACLAAIFVIARGGDGATAPRSADSVRCFSLDTGSSMCWEQVRPLGSGGFPPEAGSNDSPKWEPGRWPLTLQPIVAFNGSLWMLSQTHAWSSDDGLNWAHDRKADWGERIWQEYAFFHNRLWMFGGLRYADRVLLNDVWSSPDGVTWENAGNAEWSPRKGHRIVPFGGQLWLFGGADGVARDFSTEHALNDVWSSDDGLHWTRRADAAPWSPREDAPVVALNAALYLLGGAGQADIWRSEDGVTWTRLAAEADWQPRYGYGTAVFGGKMWVYGGWKGTPANCVNDIWYSTDGRTWSLLTDHAPWTPRSPRTIVYNDRLWILSGKHTGARDNWGGDIWTMRAGSAR